MTVVTLTFRRPLDLADALPGLVEHVRGVPGAELLVVDNDTIPSARDTVESWSVDHPVRYVHEPAPGIAAARNRGLAEAADADVVVFIDDDERPRQGWLESLLATHARENCAAVAGAVVSVFDSEPEKWIRAGRFFDRLRHPTGTELDVVATNNLLLDAALIRSWDLTFDDEFGLTGGSDTVFSLELRRRGGRLVWCDEAVVEDVVPAARATRSWVLRRAFRMGNTGSRARLHVARGRSARFKLRVVLVAHGLVRLGGGAAGVAWGAVSGSLARRARGSRTVVRGAGMILGAFGYVYSEYARPVPAPTPVAARG
ncbi:glycosyltransferase [Cellulomonas sp. JH27-2]|nr:glycosyltransferase [Cellulomonas sp. JH27-2]